MKCFVFGTDHIVVIFIVNILIPRMVSVFCFGANIGGGKYTAAFKNSFANPRGLVGTVGRYNFVLGVMGAKVIVQRIKGNAVVDIPRSHMDAENKVVFVTGGMRFVGKHLLVLALVENAAVRVGGGNRLFHHFRLPVGFLPVLLKRLLPAAFPILVDFLEQFMGISLGFFGYSLSGLLLQIRIRLNVRSVYKNSFGVQISLIGRRL